MKINGEDDLRNILSRAFSAYGNKVANGATKPFQGWLTSDEAIDAQLVLHADGSLEITPIFLENKTYPKIPKTSFYETVMQDNIIGTDNEPNSYDPSGLTPEELERKETLMFEEE